MSRQARSNRPDLDYGILHRTGRRVPKVRGPKMASQGLQTQAIHISSDMEDLLDSYDFENLEEEEELNEYVTKLGDLKRNFRRVHSELKIAEGNAFKDRFPDFDANLSELSEKFKIANKKLNDIKKEKKDSTLKIKDSQSCEKKLQCKAERKFFIDKVNWELDGCVWQNLHDFESIKIIITTFEARLEFFYKMCSDLEVFYGDQVVELGLNIENEKLISFLREKITSGKIRLTEIKSEKDLLEKEKREEADHERELSEAKKEWAKTNELMVCAENLHFEIKTRYDIFTKKCSVEMSELDDYEVLALKKREESLHVEIRELIDKVSSFEKCVIPCGNLATTLRAEVIDMRAKCTKLLDTVLDDVARAIKSRDISEKKLENAAGLKIELQKFRGYNSEVDIYTFRSEFHKLVEPNVVKSLWPDHLKKNCLAGSAYNLVSKIDKIEDIWAKLLEVYGNTQLMLQNKLSSLEKFSNLEKMKDDEKIANTLISLLNAMTDLSNLAKDYDLEGELYHGGGIHRILDLMGKQRERRFIKSIARDNLKNEAKWTRLTEFLQNELKEREACILNEKAKKYMSSTKGNNEDKDKNKRWEKEEPNPKSSYMSQPENPHKYVCHICGKSEDHVSSIDSNQKIYVEYVACKTFVDKTPRDRNNLLFKKRFCNKCLKPGVKWDSEHSCTKRYRCNQPYVKNGKELKCEKHVLVCGYHCKEKNNIDLLEVYKKNVIMTHGKFFDFSKEVGISCFSQTYTTAVQGSNPEDSSVFAFQKIHVAGLELNMFYDSGCGDLVVSKEIADKLKQIGRAEQIFAGSLVLNGVGRQESICMHGVYRVRLPLKDGSESLMSGICVDEITVPFPKYPLKLVEKDIRDKIAKTNKDLLKSLPKLPNEVGGKVDIMIGKQYLKYFPIEITRLESGLTLYDSLFESSDGSTGVVSGPHPEFTKTERIVHFAYDIRYNYYIDIVHKYVEFLSLQQDVPLLGYTDSPDPKHLQIGFENGCRNPVASTNHHLMSTFPGKVDIGCEFGDPFAGWSGMDHNVHQTKRRPKWLKLFELDRSGTNISYRCMDCRNCKECKKGSLVEEISIQEEVEQDLINKSVKVDIETQVSSAKLPFTADPDSRLVSNLKTARKIYDSQLKKLGKSPVDKKDIIDAEDKLQKLGFMDYLDNLDEDDRNMILNSSVKYYIPWRVVWSKSISTPVRPVFDASQRTPSGYSLNDILPKGSNNMNNLVQIILRWFIKLWAYHTDIRKMYNAVQLDKCHWRFQLYLWQKDLDPKEEPKTKFIKTIIYGAKPSGNQAERALRLTSEMSMDMYPKAYEIIQNDVYVDDCISGEKSKEDRMVATDELKLSLEKGGFTLKGFTFSGEDPDVKLSSDGESINVGGVKWFPKDDYLMFNISELNFARKIRGRKVDNITSIPNNLTMRNCVSIVSEVFDPTGRVSPIIAGFKLDISFLHRRGLTWDDKLPENLRNVWVSNFEMIQELGQLKYRRAIVPHDAKNLDIVTIDTADASSSMICAAIYARFEMKDGSFSCQLVFARTKVLPVGISIPRAELMAASMNAATGFTVQKAFGCYHKKAIKITDSMVALHWISSQRATLKIWVRTRVIEINRLCETSMWRYVESSNMVADLGTRKGAKIADVSQDSDWINGLPWMSNSEEEFPTLTLEEIKLDQYDMEEANKEKITMKSFHSIFHTRKKVEFDLNTDEQIKSRYKLSNYLIDPNRFRYKKVVRIIALVFTFIKESSKNIQRIQEMKIFHYNSVVNLPDILMCSGDKYLVTMGSNTCSGVKVVTVTENMLKSAVFYLSFKASKEITKFVEEKKYVNISKEIDGVLYYSGRILPDYQFDGYPELCEAAIDLCRTSFCVPVMDQYSPTAISIAMEVHWYHPDVKHTGIEAILRQTERVAHIIGGRNLAISIKRGCKRCRILNQKSIEVVMGPIQNVNLCIAPAFYATQVDIFGPFKSYSTANKRATIKVWFSIFCCCTTGAIDIRLMEDYSTDSFVQGFIRFACRFGYPKYVLPDAGSQLVKGCENIKYSFTDTKEKLSNEYGVQYIPCPVGAHYVHGKVERKIREVKKSVKINTHNERLSVVQWETLMQQVSNSINNMPIGLKNKTRNLEHLDLITPNRLILGRNNRRCPNAPLLICNDHKKMIENNANIFRAWFKAWIISYVPQIIERPKWHRNDGEMSVGDVVLFLKSEKEYDEQYQYGIICAIHKGTDGQIRRIDVEYKNHNEGTKRVTQRGIRDLIIVYPIDELDIYEKLDNLT